MKKISVEVYTRSGEIYIGDEKLLSDTEYSATLEKITEFANERFASMPIDGSLCYFNPRNIEAIIIREKM